MSLLRVLGDKETLEASQTTRRDFLKYVGFSTAAASLAACELQIIMHLQLQMDLILQVYLLKLVKEDL